VAVVLGELVLRACGFLVLFAASPLAFERAPPGRRNQALAIYHSANLVGASLGASGFGWLAEGAGYRFGCGQAGCVLAPGVLLFWCQP
jgi:predicted MFS family arabinose efflux permease